MSTIITGIGCHLLNTEKTSSLENVQLSYLEVCGNKLDSQDLCSQPKK